MILFVMLFVIADGLLNHRLAVYDVLVNDIGNHVRSKLHIGNLLIAGSVHLSHGLQAAYANTTRLGHHYIAEAPLLNLLHKGVQHGTSAGSNATGSHAHHDTGSGIPVMPHVYTTHSPVSDLFQFF